MLRTLAPLSTLIRYGTRLGIGQGGICYEQE
jgi:hypothetical protein